MKWRPPRHLRWVRFCAPVRALGFGVVLVMGRAGGGCVLSGPWEGAGSGTSIAGEQADLVPGSWGGSRGQLCFLSEVEAA